MSIVFVSGHADVRTSVKAMKRERSIFSPSRWTSRISSTRLSGRSRGLLTPREVEVFAHVVTGMMNRQVGAALGIGEKTVKVHRARVMENMRVGSVAELVRLAAEAGVTVPNP